MNNGVLLFTIIVMLVGLAYTMYAVFFDSEKLPEQPLPTPKRKRGRPKGSKNKVKKTSIIVNKPKRGPGRPKGSKNKKRNVKAN
jgi:hypothetical protein